jgi:CRP-like cAMP-binding protein
MAKNPSFEARNKLLSRLPQHTAHRLLQKTESVALNFKEVLYEVRGPIEHAYFPIDGVLSAVTVMQDGSAIEVATVGNEGAVGLPTSLETSTSPIRIFVQVAGHGLRIDSAILRDETKRDPALSDLFGRYSAAFIFQISTSVACNGLHPIEKRCCRWLLMTHDRVASDDLPLTHEFLAMMLGVRCAGVSEVLQSLELDGLIGNKRGTIKVLDRKGLEAKCCECFRNANEEYRRLMG